MKGFSQNLATRQSQLPRDPRSVRGDLCFLAMLATALTGVLCFMPESASRTFVSVLIALVTASKLLVGVRGRHK